MDRDDRIVAREEAAAAEEARHIGGEPIDDGVDERDRPVIEAGGGYAEGYDVAETDLVRNATHDDGEGDPLADRFTAERESDRSTADYGEPDDLHGPDDLAGSADR